MGLFFHFCRNTPLNPFTLIEKKMKILADREKLMKRNPKLS